MMKYWDWHGVSFGVGVFWNNWALPLRVSLGWRYMKFIEVQIGPFIVGADDEPVSELTWEDIAKKVTG